MDFKKEKFSFISLGEVMLRLSAPGFERIAACDMFEKEAGGSEFNICAALSALGEETAFATLLPENALGDFVRNKMRLAGVNESYAIGDNSDAARLGVYMVEPGAAPRKPTVVYDRKNSSFCRASASDFPDDIYAQTSIFHTSGITLALNSGVQDMALDMAGRFKRAGAQISFDVNFRANLWSESEARAGVSRILPLVDILYISEESLRKMFGRSGGLNDILKDFSKEFDIDVIASTRRRVISAENHTIGSLIYSAAEDRVFSGRDFENIRVVDRIGSGDAYVAGVTYGLLKDMDMEETAEYGNALAAVKCTIKGDVIKTSLKEIEKIVENNRTGGGSEMNR